ncbi:type II toxin-antitoxin system prevent-host-death family antitoxin [Candidatus Aquicultor secundus]|uniref:Antitoxin n=1 Tax=Candidatus Aquicultor secundus TaxID=1973895 RepID=A0A2M7T7Y3_9ACTN|nr:type II toxin-antitoxin system prevent-host-death family antitoxin [Candidatus Aquicultor secundus]PIZ38918.1 MAG: hypothetical protein COY37_05630 [Candidatus Aquicultor secundus]
MFEVLTFANLVATIKPEIATRGVNIRVKKVTARELKNKTGEIIRKAREGEKFLITVRGKPAAAILPAEYLEKKTGDLRPAEQAWKDIEETLKQSSPEFKTWQEAMAWTRKRA